MRTIRLCLVLLAPSLLLAGCGRSDEPATADVGGTPAAEAADAEAEGAVAEAEGEGAEASTGTGSRAPPRPNIVLIVADDLGYSDLGAFGSEIPTPNIDSLAREGMLLTQFYTSMTCSPTRSMLLSGTDSHVAGLGVMAGRQTEAQEGQPGYEGYLNLRVAALPELLRNAGYRTYMTGKWHLGAGDDTNPAARGFDRSFASVDGAAHLGGLSWNGPGAAPYLDDGEQVHVGDDFYSTRFYTERMIEYIEADRDEERPFFAYLAYTAPHWPLQAPAESIARFEGWYDEGYEALYRRRLERAKALGLAPADFEGTPPVEGEPRWEELTEEERRIEARKMEIFAAMVSDLDAYVGHFVSYLESIDELDNTFIFFMSDNGPEALRRDLEAPLSDWVAECCDNSYENLGAGDSYVMYGPSWARAGTAPFRGAKQTAFEGGIRVPAFARWPAAVAAGGRSDAFGTVMDLLPTLLELAGAEHPAMQHERAKPVARPLGKSLLPLLSGETDDTHSPDQFVGWELFGHRAVRQGDWKIVWDAREGDEARWKLFNLAEDPGERRDLAEARPDRLAAMRALWDRYVRENGVILDE